MIDVIIVSLIVLAAVIAIIVFLHKWKKEDKTYGERRKALKKEAAKVESSSLVD